MEKKTANQMKAGIILGLIGLISTILHELCVHVYHKSEGISFPGSCRILGVNPSGIKQDVGALGQFNQYPLWS